MQRQEFTDCVEQNILPFWLTRMVDRERGGFYGQMTGQGEIVATADKGGILNARILWAFAAAYRVLRKPEYLAAARRAKDYIIAHFIDPVYGGTYWAVDCDGNAVDTKKQFYAIGFTLYGLSEFVRATHGDPSVPREESDRALHLAVSLFNTIEEQSLDIVYNGYIEARTRQWGEIGDCRLSALDQNFPKSQNTHLHIIEPYTNLYRLLCELEKAGREVSISLKSKVEVALRNLIDIFTTKILNPTTHHLDLFFEKDWTRESVQRESYGHDIECSWLMHEAALVLGDPAVLRRVEEIVRLVAAASEKGINADGSMTHEANITQGTVDDERHWWVQAEAVVGFYNLYQHFGDTTALDKAGRCWQYIKQNLIDHDLGEWYWSRDRNGVINLKDDHAGFWKCPYHNTRMCLEMIERI